MADPILDQRRALGPVERHTVAASSLTGAHAALGAWIGTDAREAIGRRLSATEPGELARQITGTRACRSAMEARARPATAAVKRGVEEYFACLDAWSRSAELARCLRRPIAVAGQPVSAEDLALWAQDDNTGCLTGMLRTKGGSVLLWHIEEDTIGYFDRPRVVTFALPGGALSAFLYPYLLPGPAFGWGAGQIHAIDSLHVRRSGEPGTFTGVASWLIWRLGAAADTREILQALSPFVDGCAINAVRPSGRAVSAATHELGGRHLASRRLGAAPGSLSLQANAVCRAQSAFGRDEDLRAAERALYDRRVGRAAEAVERTRSKKGDPTAEDVLRMMASRRGGSYAYANRDVKAHCVARISAAGIEVHVGSGSAHPADEVRLSRVDS